MLSEREQAIVIIALVYALASRDPLLSAGNSANKVELKLFVEATENNLKAHPAKLAAFFKLFDEDLIELTIENFLTVIEVPHHADE